MLKLQDELSQQEHPSQSGGNPECNDQPLQGSALIICIVFCINVKAIAGRTQFLD